MITKLCDILNFIPKQKKNIELNYVIKVTFFGGKNYKNNLYDQVMTWSPDDQYQSTIFCNKNLYKLI